jgi:hypothetical protein
MSGRRTRGLSLSVALVMVAVLLPTSSVAVAADVGVVADHASQGGWACESNTGAETTASVSPGQEFAPDQILVRFRPSVAAGRADQILAERGLSRMRRITPLDVHVLRLPPGLSVERAVEIFGRLPEVEFAEPNYILHALAPAGEVIDEFDQWGLSRIQAPDAWGVIGENPPPVLLATVDTGIDRTHSDLAANIWENTGETAGNGIDDDGNGYVDDTWGWDFQNGDNDPYDDNKHGTLVSSVAAGVQDGSGVAGVCPWCQLMAVKVLGSDGSGTLDTVADGIIYAADSGARVINLSLGGERGGLRLEPGGPGGRRRRQRRG